MKTKKAQEDFKFFRPRFMAKVDAKLRKRISRRGELMKLIILILKSVDLTTIPLLEISSDLQDLAETTVKLPVALYAKLRRVADQRTVSMNVIVNSAVWEYKEKPDDEA